MSQESANEKAIVLAEEPSPKLNPRQRAFVAEYLKDLNGTQAAIRAGYSPDTAASIASEYLTKPGIAAAVAKGQAQRLERVNMTADSVLHEMSLLAASRVDHYEIDDHGNLRPTPDAPEGAMAAVSSIKKKIRHDKEGGVTYEVEFRLWDKPGTLKLMGRHVGVAACSDKVEVVGKDGGPIEIIARVVRVIIDPRGNEIGDVIDAEAVH